MSPLHIRPATAADHPDIEAMAREVVLAGEMFAYDTVAGALGYWDDPAGSVWVAERDGAVVGTYVLKPCQPGHGAHVGNAGYMTRAEARGTGVGRALAEHSLERAREHGYRALQFNFVVATNADAVHLWHSLGFRTLARLPEAFRRPDGTLVDALVLHRWLDGRAT